MWESSIWRPQGSVSLRRIFVLATALFVACFVYIITSAPLAHAADAEFNGETLTYNSQQFSGPFTADGTDPPNLAKEVKYYTAIDPSDSTKATVIYFARGQIPKDTDTAHVVTATANNSGKITALSTNDAKTISVATAASATEGESKSSCQIEGIGWIACPLSKSIASGVDFLFKVITYFLQYEPLTTAGSSNSIYSMWNVVRSIANVAFVIAFLIIIYSEMTSSMFNSYTVKKILPRIVVAAVLVNISFWICAIAIDISNILGASVYDLFHNLQGSLDINVDAPLWSDLVANALAGTGIVVGGSTLLVAIGGSAGALFWLIVAALVPVIFAALVAVAILAARQALITLFVIIAPLAFVAYLLPNTEEWFNRWRKLFITMLVMYPAFALLFSASQIAGLIIMQNSKDFVGIVFGLTVQAIPLFVTPFLIKLSSGVLGTVAGLANDKSKGIFDRTKNWADANRKLHQQRGFSKRPAQTRRGVLRPTDLARRLNNNRLYREQMTAKHQAKAEAQFAQTERGRRVYARGADANLRQHAADEANKRAWTEDVYGANGLRHSNRAALHHAAHIDAGRAKLIEDRATAHAERDLQTSINATAALRNLKIQTDVDNAHAKFQSSVVEAEGKAVFQQEVLADRALRLANVQRVAHEKESATIEKTLQSRADAHWERLAATNAGVQQIRLQEVEATDSFKLAEAQFNSIVSDIRANADNATGFISGDTGLTRVIRNQTQAIKLEGERSSSFEIQQQRNFANDLAADQGLQWYAGGDRREGATAAAAKASSTIAKANAEIIANIKEASDIEPGNTAAMSQALQDAVARGDINSARAHIDMLAASANPGISALRTTLGATEAQIRANPEMLELLRHHINSSSDINAGAEDIATWSRDFGNGWRNLADISADANTWSNVTANNFAGLKMSTQEQALNASAISPQTAYDIFNSPAKGTLKPNIRARILTLAQQVDPDLR